MDGAPTGNLFVELPGEGVVQMCYMRVEAHEVCPPLPYLLPLPDPGEAWDLLRSSTVLRGEDFLTGEDYVDGAGGSSYVTMRCTEEVRTRVLVDIRRALSRLEPLPSSCRNLQAADWQAALAAGDGARREAPQR